MRWQLHQTLQEQAKKNEQFKHFASNLIVRYEGDPAAAAAEVRRTLLQINPDIVIRQLTTYDEQVSSYFTRQKMLVQLTTIFGILALILASLGLYGVTAYGVAQRVPEIGLRMALGADRASVVRLILRGAAQRVTIGLLLGVSLALIAGHFLESQLYEVKGYSASPLLVACAALAPERVDCKCPACAKSIEHRADAGFAHRLADLLSCSTTTSFQRPSR